MSHETSGTSMQLLWFDWWALQAASDMVSYWISLCLWGSVFQWHFGQDSSSVWGPSCTMQDEHPWPSGCWTPGALNQKKKKKALDSSRSPWEETAQMRASAGLRRSLWLIPVLLPEEGHCWDIFDSWVALDKSLHELSQPSRFLRVEWW